MTRILATTAQAPGEARHVTHKCLANQRPPRGYFVLKRANHMRLSVNNEIIKYVKVSVTTQYNIIRGVKPYRDTYKQTDDAFQSSDSVPGVSSMKQKAENS